MATGCITAPFVSQQHGVTGKLRFGCLHCPDQRLTNTVHSFMVREGCNRPTVAWSTLHKRLPRVQPRHALDFNKCAVWWDVCVCVCIQPNNLNQYFRVSSKVWKLFPSKQSSTLEPLKMECGVKDGLVAAAKNTPFLFHLATGWHKYYSAASNRYGDHEEETEQ